MQNVQLIILGFLVAFFSIVLVMGVGMWLVLSNTQGGNWLWFIPDWAIPLLFILIGDGFLILKFGWSKRWYPFLAGQLLCIILCRWGFLILKVISLGVFR